VNPQLRSRHNPRLHDNTRVTEVAANDLHAAARKRTVPGREVLVAYDVAKYGGPATHLTDLTDPDDPKSVVKSLEVDGFDLAKALGDKYGKKFIVYPESKNPYWNNAQAKANGCRSGDHSFEDAILKIIADSDLNGADAPPIVQSFDPASLKYLRSIGLETMPAADRRQRGRLSDR
jgi:glycerophosphoryl diester phosphodiesterase